MGSLYRMREVLLSSALETSRGAPVPPLRGYTDSVMHDDTRMMRSAMLGEREFTTEEIAQICGVSRPAVVEWVTRGLLPARLTEGGHRRVARSTLAAFLGKRAPVFPGR